MSGSTAAGSTTQPQGVGSGFIYDTDDHIVTNNHVVEQADLLRKTFSDYRFVAASARPTKAARASPSRTASRWSP
jgi:S1-C subfamily serine protease